jgi:Domain of unknown function (DUF222)/HNH endonuclease
LSAAIDRIEHMFDKTNSVTVAASPALQTATLAGWGSALMGLDDHVDDGERIDQIRLLEQLKSAVAAAQARVTAAFSRSQRAEQKARGAATKDLGKGVGSQVALARRDSPVKGSRHLGLANALVLEMPHTLAALEAGVISEWRATLLVRETACLTREDRGKVDAELAGRLETMGDARTAHEARRIAYALDPGSVMRRVRGAHADRRVSIRPAPDTMSHVTGFLPAAQGVAVIAALTKHADSLRSQGDDRSRGQIMADTFVERLTGQATATGVPVEVHLVMPHTSLLGADHTPAHLQGYGPLPAAFTRRWIRGLSDDAGEALVWIRRLYAHPETRRLVAMESTSRLFPKGLRQFLIVRDQTCRTPFCDAPIRHGDHVTSAEDGGQTSAENGQGLCEACNHTKQTPGWRSRARPDGTVETTTPTGHTYLSHAPPLPHRQGVGEPSESPLEVSFRRLVQAA